MKIPDDLELSFSIPQGFSVILSDASRTATHVMVGDGTPCQALDLALLEWTPAIDTVVEINRDWMVEFYETEDCSGTPLTVQFDIDDVVDQDQLVDMGWN